MREHQGFHAWIGRDEPLDRFVDRVERRQDRRRLWMSKAEKVAYVKSQHQTRQHHCHWPDCDRQVPPALWGCKQHWLMLPRDLRNKIWSAYEPGQESIGRPSSLYLDVLDEVDRYFRQCGVLPQKSEVPKTEKLWEEKPATQKRQETRKMKVTLHLEGSRQEVLTQIDEFKLVLSSSLEAQPSKAATKAAKTTKAKKEEPEEEPAEEEADPVDAEEDPTDGDDIDLGEDEPEEDTGPSLDQVKKALKAFAGKGEKFKEKAMALLKSYKIKHVDELPKTKYAEVLKKLK